MKYYTKIQVLRINGLRSLSATLAGVKDPGVAALGATSTDGMIKRLGGERWNRLHPTEDARRSYVATQFDGRSGPWRFERSMAEAFVRDGGVFFRNADTGQSAY